MGRFAAVAGVLALASVAGFPLFLARAQDQSFPAVRSNPADRLAELPIDDFAYDTARRCTRSPKPGTLALQAWIGRHFRGVSWGIMRCEKLGRRNYSLHAEGRALDWHLDVHDRRDRAEAERLIGVLLAPDRLGNPEALARRMGVQEIIWDCKTWWAGSPALEPYPVCFNKHGKRRRHVDETLAHRNHVHIGLNRLGAARQTSFWRAGVR
jgi:hypothetical protein